MPRHVLFALLAAAILPAQTSLAPSDLLLQARRDILRSLRDLPRYTCIQTLIRTYYGRAYPWRSCAGARPEEPGTLRPQGSDRLRLDIGITSAGRELYSWTGGQRFESEQIQDVIGPGPIGTGSFGPFLIDIFGNRGSVRFTHQGSEVIDGRSLVKFGFSVPKQISHYEFQTAGQREIVAYGGAFWLDAHTSGLVRLQVFCDSMPHFTGTCEATNTVDFHQVSLGGREFLLPRASLLEFTAMPGYYVNASEFSGCRQFQTESAVRFEEPGPVRELERRTNTAEQALPRGLPVVLALENEIDTARAAAGDVITAVTRTDIRASRSRDLIVPAGAVAHGRILRLEHRYGTPPTFLISIRFEKLESGGRSLPFSAVLDPAVYLAHFTVSLADLANGIPSPPRSRNFSAGRTLVFESKEPGYVVPLGYESKWITSR